MRYAVHFNYNELTKAAKALKMKNLCVKQISKSPSYPASFSMKIIIHFSHRQPEQLTRFIGIYNDCVSLLLHTHAFEWKSHSPQNYEYFEKKRLKCWFSTIPYQNIFAYFTQTKCRTRCLFTIINNEKEASKMNKINHKIYNVTHTHTQDRKIKHRIWRVRLKEMRMSKTAAMTSHCRENVC